jgi:hypothetical protein
MGSRLSGSHTATLPGAIIDLSCESGYPWDKYEAWNDEGQDDPLRRSITPFASPHSGSLIWRAVT